MYLRTVIDDKMHFISIKIGMNEIYADLDLNKELKEREERLMFISGFKFKTGEHDFYFPDEYSTYVRVYLKKIRQIPKLIRFIKTFYNIDYVKSVI